MAEDPDSRESKLRKRMIKFNNLSSEILANPNCDDETRDLVEQLKNWASNDVGRLMQANGQLQQELEKLIRQSKSKTGYGPIAAPLHALDAINKAARRNNYPPSMRAALEKYGNNKIVSLTVGRNPIQSAIQKVANTLVGDKLKNLNIDTLFHLFLVIGLDNGMKFKTERNQVLNFTPTIGDIKESMTVPLNKSITLKEFFDNAIKRVGNMLFTYSAANNNCQSYIMQLLGSNGLNSDSLKKFIKQDTNTLLSPFLKKVTDTITDTAATADRLIHGAGKTVKMNF